MKYGNRRTEMDGYTFDSKKEAHEYIALKYMEKAGLISDLRLQVPFELIPSQRDEDGRVIERPVRYVADFVYEQNGKTVVEDVKSPATRTKEYVLKRKLLLHKFGIQIKEV